jgi:hypothetical protein
MPGYIFYTFRPQISDQGLFEDFLILFLPFVKEHKEYAYTVENDGTLHKHIHAIIAGPKSGQEYKDLDKFYQKFNKTNGLKEFKDFARKHSSTTEDGFKPMKVKDTKEDLLHVIGYTLKEHAQRQETNLPNSQVTSAIEYYHAHQRIKSKNPMRKDWILLTGKNLNVHMERYIDDNNIVTPQPLLPVIMAADRYCLHNCSEKQFRQAQAEIHLAKSKEEGIEPDHDEKEQVFTYGNNTKDSFLFESIEPIAQQNLNLRNEVIELRTQLADRLEYIKGLEKDLVKAVNKN